MIIAWPPAGTGCTDTDIEIGAVGSSDAFAVTFTETQGRRHRDTGEKARLGAHKDDLS